jgi:uroporphyrinogen decarboxylase
VTPLEALGRTLAGERVRPLVLCNLLEQGAREVGASLRDYYADGELVAEGQLRLRARYGHDAVWALLYVAKEAELLGAPPSSIAFVDDGPPTLARPPYASPEAALATPLPDDLRDQAAMREPLRCLRALRREVGGRVPIVTYVTASTTLPALLLGMEAYMALLLDGPSPALDALLARCSDVARREIALYREEGADVVLYASPFASTDLLPRPLVERVVLPWVERDLAPRSDGVVFYAGAARVADTAGLVRQRVGLRAFYPGPTDDLAAVRRAVGPDALVAGVVNDVRLVDGSMDDVRAEVRRVFAHAPGGPFLFGTVLMPLAMPEPHVRALVDEAIACADAVAAGAPS